MNMSLNILFQLLFKIKSKLERAGCTNEGMKKSGDAFLKISLRKLRGPKKGDCLAGTC